MYSYHETYYTSDTILQLTIFQRPKHVELNTFILLDQELGQFMSPLRKK